MDILKIVLYIIFVIDCIALSAIILLQEGKSAGLGTIGGMADTYWGQNKGRSMEGALVKSTKFLAILFLVLAVVLNLNREESFRKCWMRSLKKERLHFLKEGNTVKGRRSVSQEPSRRISVDLDLLW